MKNFKSLMRGLLATSAMFCLVSFGVAQDQSSSSSSNAAAKSDTSTKPKKAAKSATAGESSSASGQLSAADKQFVMKAAEGGLAEVQLGQLAADKASNADVKQFGQRMVDDHSKANDQLKSVAQQKGIDLPTDLNAKDKALKDKLSGLSGQQFDKMYMSHMLMDHKKDVAEFQKESKSAKDNDIKNWAAQTLPTLQDHLKQAEKVAGSTGASASSHGKMHEKSGKKASTTASSTPQ